MGKKGEAPDTHTHIHMHMHMHMHMQMHMHVWMCPFYLILLVPRGRPQHSQRELAETTSYAASVVELQAALATVHNRIVLAAGTYEFDGSTACNSASWLCVDRAVTIEAAEAGTVVLDAQGARRVLNITGTGVQLVGLNITGGRLSAFSSVVLAFRTFRTFLPAPRWNVTQVLAFCMRLHAGRRALHLGRRLCNSPQLPDLQ